jgi:hypothetical protein
MMQDFDQRHFIGCSIAAVGFNTRKDELQICQGWVQIKCLENANDLCLFFRKKFVPVRKLRDIEEGKQTEGDSNGTFDDLASVRFRSTGKDDSYENPPPCLDSALPI